MIESSHKQSESSQRLLAAARGGDAEAFCELCRQFETGLLRHALALTRNLASAEELAQETLVEAWRSLRRFDGRSQFFTWLCAILLNRYRNSLRQRRPLLFFSPPGGEREGEGKLERLVSPSEGPDEIAGQRDEAAAIRACIDALPARHQEIIYLRFYVDDSLEGIASALGCSLGTVKSRLFRALENLREMPAMKKNPNLISSEP